MINVASIDQSSWSHRLKAGEPVNMVLAELIALHFDEKDVAGLQAWLSERECAYRFAIAEGFAAVSEDLKRFELPLGRS